MQSKRRLRALVAWTAVLAVMVLPGGGAAANGPDLSSAQSIDSYLLSIGVDPASAVRQNGRMNWAGANCPGKPWNCTTANVIVQVATTGGINQAFCDGRSRALLPGDRCIVVQVGPLNMTQCAERGSSPQDCTIAQSGPRNTAIIQQTIDQNGGDTQDALQTASLTQTSDTAFNHATVNQTVNQSTGDGTTQNQNAHQKLTALQTATNAAQNALQVDQSQDQKAFGGTTQNQNATGSDSGDCSTNTPTQPNECVNIEQSSNSGNNNSHLHQSLNQDANAGGSDPATQQQGDFSGGMEGRIHQDTASGTQLNDANQSKRQHLSAPDGSSQTQFDPVYCCGVGSQVGGTGMENINQSSAQDATEDDASQESALIGQSLTPDGTCTIMQKASNNVDSASNSESLTPCPFLVLATACTNGPEIDIESSTDVGIQQQLPPGCETFEDTGNTDVCLVCVAGPGFFALRQG
jgi:hypothetical protein